MKCPMHTLKGEARRIRDGFEQNVALFNCVEEECAWWDKDKCVIMNLKELKYLASLTK